MAEIVDLIARAELVDLVYLMRRRICDGYEVEIKVAVDLK